MGLGQRLAQREAFPRRLAAVPILPSYLLAFALGGQKAPELTSSSAPTCSLRCALRAVAPGVPVRPSGVFFL